jgi:hypothetical protein
MPSTSPAKDQQVKDHAVQFYSDDAFLAAKVSATVRSALQRDDAVLIIATLDHIDLFTKRFEADGLDTKALIASEKLDMRDAHRMLASLLVSGWPDEIRFDNKIGRLARQKLLEHKGLTAYGEMVDILWDAGKRDAALQLEALWNDLKTRHSFSLLCAYRADPLDSRTHVDHFDGVCAAHDQSILSENPGKLELAFKRALNQAVPSRHLQILNSWIAKSGHGEGSRVSQSVIWLRRHMPEHALNVLHLTRSFLRTPLAL